MGRKPYSIESDPYYSHKRFEYLYRKCGNLRDFAALMGVCPSTARSWLIKLGVTLQRPGRKPKGSHKP